MDDFNAQANTLAKTAESMSFGRSLKSTHELKDSHFKGGVAAAAFDTFKTMSADDFKLDKGASKKVKATNERGRKVETSHMPELPQMVGMKKTSDSTQTASINLILNSFDKKVSQTASKVMKSSRSQKQFKEVSAFLLFILTTGISIAYYVTFKTYHTAVAKMDSLKKLLKNPNARVAAGNKGKEILNRIKAEKKTIEAPKKIVQSTKSSETVTLLKELITARQTQQQYDTPLLELEQPKPKLAAPAPKKDDTLSQIKKVLAERHAPKVQAV